MTRTAVQTNDDVIFFPFGATTFTTISSVSITATSGSLIIATFSAESVCTGGAGSGWCAARILVDGVEADPAAGLDFAFDSTDNGTNSGLSWEAHSFQRARNVTFSGAHVVEVQLALQGAASGLRLDDRNLTVMAVAP